MHGRTHILIAAGLALLTAASLRGAEPVDDGRLRIELRPEVEVAESVVRVADVAEITGGNAVQRERIGDFDLFELPAGESPMEVQAVLIEARLLLGGETDGSFVVTGTATVSLSASHGSEQRVLQACQDAISKQLSIARDDVVAQLATPLAAELTDLINATESGQLAARPAAPIGGRTRVDLWLQGSRRGQVVRPIVVDVQFRQLAPVAARPLKARQKLTENDVVLETRDLPHLGQALTLEQLIGTTLRKPVAAGAVVNDRDLIPVVDETRPVLIRPRDIVRVTAKKRNLILEMPAAEAMQAGRLGETIRVRNTATQKVIIGRVAGPGEVEVPL